MQHPVYELKIFTRDEEVWKGEEHHLSVKLQEKFQAFQNHLEGSHFGNEPWRLIVIFEFKQL